jgi:hypothetical protein
VAALIHLGSHGDADRPRPSPDHERAQPLRPLGLRRDVYHDGHVGTVAHPLDEIVNAVGRSLEDRLDPPVGKVAYPTAHTMLEGPSPAGVAEVDALDPAGDEHPIADHKQTLRGDWASGHAPAPRPAARRQHKLTRILSSTYIDDLANRAGLAEAASGGDPAEGLRAARALRELAERLEALQVGNARAHGWSWAEIAFFLGVSKQAVHKKHAARLPPG